MAILRHFDMIKFCELLQIYSPLFGGFVQTLKNCPTLHLSAFAPALTLWQILSFTGKMRPGSGGRIRYVVMLSFFYFAKQNKKTIQNEEVPWSSPSEQRTVNYNNCSYDAFVRFCSCLGISYYFRFIPVYVCIKKALTIVRACSRVVIAKLPAFFIFRG